MMSISVVKISNLKIVTIIIPPTNKIRSMPIIKKKNKPNKNQSTNYQRKIFLN